MKTGGNVTSFQNLFIQTGSYRINQGRIIRTFAFFFLVSSVILASQQLFFYVYRSFGLAACVCVAIACTSVGAWISYRLIHYPPVADFLIDVQHESLKVSWCTWRELHRTTVVILSAMIIFSIYLFACDIFWQMLLRSLSVLSV